ncbi:MAG: molybdopterin-dependent oxidoreductase [Chloroflexi bacterium]|nr:molybdopterin-dependent oxidoreductase [Chloroflexota bacterium]
MSEQKQESKKRQTGRLRKAMPVFIVGLLCIVAAIVVYAHPWQNASEADIEWNLTLIGSSGDNVTLSLDDIKAMKSTTAQGGFFTTTGVINGPYDVKGVSIEDVCDLVGGMGLSDLVFVSATDGYSSVFDYDQVSGNLPTYDPVTLKEMPHEKLGLTLIYEQDGKPLSYDDGKPVRLAVVGSENLLTEGFYWVKWVDRIEVIHQD